MADDESADRDSANKVLQIANCSVLPAACRVERDGEAVRIEPRTMAVLQYLAARPGEVVTRQELEDAIWTGTVVGYKALTNTIIKLRKALADDARNPRIIETISKHGYRLIAEVSHVPTEAERGTQVAATVPTARAPAIPQSLGKPSVTVKPFENIGAEAEQERLADTFTCGIVVALTRIPGLVLVGDESPSMTESKRMTVQEIAHRFDVQYVLRGAVRTSGERIRVSAELIDAATSRYLWAENLDRQLRDFGDFFAAQDEIVDEIVTAMNVKLLSGEAARIVRKALNNPRALESYYRGEDLLWRSTMKLEFREAQRLFEETVRLEPESPVGYAAGALTYWAEAISGLSDESSNCLARATALARDAIRLNDVTGYAHMVLAYVHLTRREFDEALAQAERAVSDRPSCPASYAIKASILTYLGRASDAIEFAQYALRLSPVHPPLFPAALASAYYSCGRYEEAVTAAQTAIELESSDISPYVLLVATHAALGCAEDAQRAAQEVLEIKPEFTLAEFAQAQPYKDTETCRHSCSRWRCSYSTWV
jgi:TolB-like protein/Flp pilus assembly protein TadD